MTFGIGQVLILLGFINSILFIVASFNTPKKYRKVARILAGFIFLFSLNIMSWSIMPKLARNFSWFCMGRNPVLFFLGPFFFAFTKQVFATPKKNVLNYKTLLPGFLDVLYTVALWIYIYFFAFEEKFDLLYNTLNLNIYQALAILYNAIYLVLSIKVYRKSRVQGSRKPFDYLFFLISFIFVAWFIYFLVELSVYPSTLSNNYYYPFWLLILALNLYLGFNILLQPGKLNFKIHSETAAEKLPEQAEEQLTKLMKEEKLYQKQDLTLSFLAGKMDISSAKLTALLKEKHHTNFYNFINNYRIAEVLDRFENGDEQQFTIQTIAEMAGFRSKTTFLKAFKEKTGLLPKEYVRQMNEK